MGFMIHLIHKASSSSSAGYCRYICTFNGTEYSDLFRFGVGILPERAGEELRILFGIWHSGTTHVQYKVHTYLGLDFEIANSYYFVLLLLLLRCLCIVYRFSLSCSLCKPPS